MTKKTKANEGVSMDGGRSYRSQSSQLRKELQQRLVDMRTTHTDIWGEHSRQWDRLGRASCMVKEQQRYQTDWLTQEREDRCEATSMF